jgi:ribosomal protein S27AE
MERSGSPVVMLERVTKQFAGFLSWLFDPRPHCPACGARLQALREVLVRSRPLVLTVEDWCPRCGETVRRTLGADIPA